MVVRPERGNEGERVRDPRTVRFEELNAGESSGSERFGEREWKPRSWRRIKHQSLILAQDERWRRA